MSWRIGEDKEKVAAVATTEDEDEKQVDDLGEDETIAKLEKPINM